MLLRGFLNHFRSALERVVSDVELRSHVEAEPASPRLELFLLYPHELRSIIRASRVWEPLSIFEQWIQCSSLQCVQANINFTTSFERNSGVFNAYNIRSNSGNVCYNFMVPLYAPWLLEFPSGQRIDGCDCILKTRFKVMLLRLFMEDLRAAFTEHIPIIAVSSNVEKQDIPHGLRLYKVSPVKLLFQDTVCKKMGVVECRGSQRTRRTEAPC